MRKLIKYLFIFVLIGGLFVLFRFTVEAGNSQMMEPTGGLVEGQLKPCEIKPNCVSTTHPANSKEHHIAPMVVTSNPIQKLSDILKEMPGVKILEENESYIQATHTSELFKFVDDVEFLFLPDSNTLHMRSSSRVGHSDMGANRERIKSIISKMD